MVTSSRNRLGHNAFPIQAVVIERRLIVDEEEGLTELDVPLALNSKPAYLFPPYFEKADPSDPNIFVVGLSPLTSSLYRLHLSSGAVAGQTLHLCYIP